MKIKSYFQQMQKKFEEIQNPFIIKVFNKLYIEEYLNIIQATYDKPTINIKLNNQEWKAFPLNSETRKEYPLSLLLSNIVQSN